MAVSLAISLSVSLAVSLSAVSSVQQAFNPCFSCCVRVCSITIAQMNPSSSRTIAVTTTFACLPLLRSLRKRPQSRTCAFQAIAWTGGDAFSARR